MINVTCAIIRNEEDEVLIVQRGEATDHPYKWEFPGGKVTRGETDEECIIREVKEELSMEIVIISKLPDVEYDYGHKHVKLIPFICDTLDEIPFLSEHISYKWLHINDLFSVDFSEADIDVARNYVLTIKTDIISEVQPLTQTLKPEHIDNDLHEMISTLMSRAEADWIANSARENPVIFNKLLEYSYSTDQKLAFRSSWALTKVCDNYPEMIVPELPAIIETLNKLDNESVQRSFLRILSFSDISILSNKHQGILADHCFNSLRSGFSAIAIKAYSMEILYKLALIYPELANELSASIKMLQEEGSAGIVARGLMILRKLAEIPIAPGSSPLSS